MIIYYLFILFILSFFLYVSVFKEIIDKRKNRISNEQLNSLREILSILKLNEKANEIIELCKKDFYFKIDNFSEIPTLWIYPKTAPNFVNKNAFYCYFGINASLNVPLTKMRFVSQYHCNEWLFIKEYKFSIDSKTYSLIPNKVNTDCGNGGFIWEWSDEVIDEDKIEIFKSIANSNNTKVKYIGKQYERIKELPKSTIISIDKTLKLYNLFGGTL